jgi:hypothetical protein
MSNVRVGAAITASFSYLSTAWSRAMGIMAAGVALVIALQIVQPMLASFPALSLVGALARICIATMTIGALYRIGVEPDHPGDPAYAVGPGGFQWGALEWRVLLANILFGLVVYGPFLLVFILLGAGLAASPGGHAWAIQGFQSGDEAQRMAALLQLFTGPRLLVSGVVLIPAALIFIYVGARLALPSPQAADSGSFSFGQAWPRTRGAVLALIVAGVLILAAEAVATLVVNAGAGLISGLMGHASTGGFWGGKANQTVDAAINAPLFAGLLLYVYRADRAQADVATTIA